MLIVFFLFQEGILCQKYHMGRGKGIRVWRLPNDKDELKKYISRCQDIIIENFLEHHPLMSALHKESVNTIRLVTFYNNNEVRVLSKIIRIGTGGNYVDNAHSGGIFCGINDDGRLKKMYTTPWVIDLKIIRHQILNLMDI